MSQTPCIDSEKFRDLENAIMAIELKDEQKTLMKAPIKIDPISKNMILDVPQLKSEELPYVSIITPTKDRKLLFHIAVFCYNRLLYPKQKFEWIILDDSEKPEEDISDILPKNDNIRHIRIRRKMSVVEKRNFGVAVAKYDIIINMDDDDYYYPDHILAKTRLFAKYPEKELIMSKTIAVYNLLTKTSHIVSPIFCTSEASMAFKKSFWMKQKFTNNKYGEGFDFIRKRGDKIIDLPYMFNFVSMTHHSNLTRSTRFYNSAEGTSKTSLLEVVSKEVRDFLLHMRDELFTKLGKHANLIVENEKPSIEASHGELEL